MVGMLDSAGGFCCALLTVLLQLFAFVFERRMFGHRMQVCRLLMLRLCARARPFARCSS